MTNSNSNCLPNLYLVHAAVALAIGLPIWLAPGHVLISVGWIPELVQLPESALSVPGNTFVNPIFVRVLGAALVALGLGTLMVWRLGEYYQVRMWAKLNLVFCALGALGIIREALRPYEYFTTTAWIGLGICVFFGLAWGKILFSGKRIDRPDSSRLNDSGLPEESVIPSGNYSKNMEETVSQMRRLIEGISEEKLKSQMLEELKALDTIMEITKLSQDARDLGTGE